MLNDAANQWPSADHRKKLRCDTEWSGKLRNQRQNAYNQLIESYGERYVDANNPKQSTNWDLFRQNVIHDENGQLTREFIEVSDWGCANGNYLEEVHLFVEEAQTSGL